MEKIQKVILLQTLSKELSFLDYDYLDLAYLSHLRHEVNTKLEKIVFERKNNVSSS